MIKSPSALVILAGDFNSLVSDDITSITGMLSIVKQPTRGANCLDTIFVNELCYDGVKVVDSTVKSDHKAIIAFNGAKPTNVTKKKACYRYRKRTPANHAAFLEHLSNLVIEVGSYGDVQENFDTFYHTLYTLFNQFYPARVITVTSTDPHLITPAIKAMLRRKNRLMRAGGIRRTDEANALAKRVRASISRQTRCCCASVTQGKALNLHRPKCGKFYTDLTTTVTHRSRALVLVY